MISTSSPIAASPIASSPSTIPALQPSVVPAGAELPSETRILLEGVSWETYERLLEETGEHRNQRFAFCDGTLEIMVPLPGHERPTRLFEHFAGVIVDALGLELLSLGSLTMKNPEQKKGLEPDCCFYIQNESVVRGLTMLDFEIHPPPDLVVEVDNTSLSLGKFPIYGALGIPEVWRLRRGVLMVYHLDAQRMDYTEQPLSLAFPQLPVQDLPRFMERSLVVGQRAAVRELTEHLQQVLKN